MSTNTSGISNINSSPLTSLQNRHPFAAHQACCECQRRKVKCDRNFPCGRCARLGLLCVPSSRKARVRARDGQGTRRAAMREPNVRLREIARSLSEDQAMNSPHTRKEFDEASGKSSSLSSTIDNYLAGTFWKSLASEVEDLADAFDEPTGRSSDDDGSIGSYQTGTIACDIVSKPLDAVPDVSKGLDPSAEADLFDRFLRHVEVAVRLFHQSSLEKFVLYDQHYLGRPSDDLCNKALKATVLYAGASTLTQTECWTKYGCSPITMITRLKRVADLAIHLADPLVTAETATVQAMVLYAMTIRLSDSSRRTWMITGIIIRVARAMGLHRESFTETPFRAEIHRRLWYNIVFLDVYASLDRGHDFTISASSFSRLLPSNCDEAEVLETSSAIPSYSGKITGMTLSLLSHEGATASLRQTVPGLSWQERLECSREFWKSMNEKYLRQCDSADPRITQTIMDTAGIITLSMALRAVRPLDREVTQEAPRVNSPWVMRLALNLLQYASRLWLLHPDGWRKMPWVPWHAIAVVLAGLCSVRHNDVADDAWALVEVSLQRYGQNIADSQSGMLWYPLQKIYKKAVEFREMPMPECSRRPVPSATATEQNVSTHSQLYGWPVAEGDSAPVMFDGDGIQLDPSHVADALQTTLFDPSSLLFEDIFAPEDTGCIEWEALIRSEEDGILH